MSSAKTWFGCGRFHGITTSRRTTIAKTAKSNHHDMSASHFEVSSRVLREDYRRTSPVSNPPKYNRERRHLEGKREEPHSIAIVDFQPEHVGAAAGDETAVQRRTGTAGKAGIPRSVQREGRGRGCGTVRRSEERRVG